jgi:hypothetical protein
MLFRMLDVLLPRRAFSLLSRVRPLGGGREQVRFQRRFLLDEGKSSVCSFCTRITLYAFAMPAPAFVLVLTSRLEVVYWRRHHHPEMQVRFVKVDEW